jgi:hypothetical protein
MFYAQFLYEYLCISNNDKSHFYGERKRRRNKQKFNFSYIYRKPNHILLAHLLTAIYSIIQYDFRKPDNQKLPAYIPTAVYFISNIPKLTIIIVE